MDKLARTTPETLGPNVLNRIIERLSDQGSVNFEAIHSELETTPLSDSQKNEIRTLVGGKILDCIRYGNFRDLRGAHSLLKSLDATQLDFDPEWIRFVEQSYDKFSLNFLLSLSPALYDGHLIDGRPYDKIDYTREQLKKGNFATADLTDDYIKKIWDIRELLIHMHSRNIDVKDVSNILGTGTLFLES